MLTFSLNAATMSKLRRGAIGTIAVTMILTIEVPREPWIVWNASSSVPVGIYWIARAAPRRGDIVAIRLPLPTSALADRRGYLPRDALLLKTIAGANGDRVCRWNSQVFVNGALSATAASADHAGRALPVWCGCLTLQPGQVIVLGTHGDSFDSRYFGPVPSEAIVGRALHILSIRS
jgi:conjugative transfer signal peptidase TraF